MKIYYTTTFHQTILCKSIHVPSHQRLFHHTWSTFECSYSETQLGETEVPSFLDGRHKPQIAIEAVETMLLTCLVIKTEDNSLDVLKATCTLWTPFFIKRITQIRSVNTHCNEGLSKKIQIKKIIVFGWSPIERIHGNISLKLYVFNDRPSKGSPSHTWWWFCNCWCSQESSPPEWEAQQEEVDALQQPGVIDFNCFKLNLIKEGKELRVCGYCAS